MHTFTNPPTCDQLRQAFEALAVRDHTLARMGFAAAMAHATWRQVIFQKATQSAHRATAPA